jgi:phage terminase Nu1 subunit (DNA packaging protein)
MKKEEFENIIKEQSNLKNLPNKKLVEFMDLLSSDFDMTKENIINSTRYLDKLEELYNNILKVYQERNNHE